MSLAYERVQAHLDRLKLKRVAELLDPIAEYATKDKLSNLNFLDRLLEAEAAGRAERRLLAKPRLAHFPFLKTLADFDFAFQPLGLGPDSRVVRHKGNEVVLTTRELELLLLRFLLDHPHRFYTTSRITGSAWSDAALRPEEVRNYVLRIREVLAWLEIPCDLVNRPGRGYSLVFRNAITRESLRDPLLRRLLSSGEHPLR